MNYISKKHVEANEKIFISFPIMLKIYRYISIYGTMPSAYENCVLSVYYVV